MILTIKLDLPPDHPFLARQPDELYVAMEPIDPDAGATDNGYWPCVAAASSQVGTTFFGEVEA